MTLRAFVAITLTAETRRALARACEEYRAAAPGSAGERWVAEENLHATVRFIGALAEDDVDRVVAALVDTCVRDRPFPMTLGRIVAHPGGRRARMLWATVADGVDAAQRLAADVEAALLGTLELEPVERAFRPHVTLCRFRKPHGVPALALAAADASLDAAAPTCGAPVRSATVVSVPGVSLLSSTLTPSGPVYRELARIPLGGD
jgi:2'-5' RNA ligase